jgi:hypothetical protein
MRKADAAVAAKIRRLQMKIAGDSPPRNLHPPEPLPAKQFKAMVRHGTA